MNKTLKKKNPGQLSAVKRSDFVPLCIAQLIFVTTI